jgi:hypothetical protein
VSVIGGRWSFEPLSMPHEATARDSLNRKRNRFLPTGIIMT